MQLKRIPARIWNNSPAQQVCNKHDYRNRNIPTGSLVLPRLFTLMLAGAFAGLMMDIRVEHVDVVRERSIAWLPIIFSGFMTIACGIGAMAWTERARRIMLLLFPAAIVVGGIGFYLHNHGHLTHVIQSSLRAWTDPQMNHSDAPPQVAPLAFVGLGVIGMLASLRRFNS